jgi:hypothetical protein
VHIETTAFSRVKIRKQYKITEYGGGGDKQLSVHAFQGLQSIRYIYKYSTSLVVIPLVAHLLARLSLYERGNVV